ncbi:hypothetical protein R84B8_02362 [Treponema sp. R8-4-B8]
MAIKFNHTREILAIRDGFPKYYEAHTSTKVQWEVDFAENDFRSAYTKDKGRDEKLVLSTKILIESKSIPVTFIENAEGALEIKVNRETVYIIKPRGRISQSLIIAFTRSIIREQK